VPKPYRVIDLFAGPGGLAEGFSSLETDSEAAFKIGLSIEKEGAAHRTLRLRALFRLLKEQMRLDWYYAYVRGDESWDSLSSQFRTEIESAEHEAWNAELGAAPQEEVGARVRSALASSGDRWALIGGPPCQAYSLVGRARMRGRNPQQFAADHRHFLYREYLKVLAEHMPPVFVMENVKGLLSSISNNEGMFARILDDLRMPGEAVDFRARRRPTYRIFSLSAVGAQGLHFVNPKEFVVRSEYHGVPQRRHRVIIIGVRSDLVDRDFAIGQLPVLPMVSVESAIGDLPRLRSGLSHNDNVEAWNRTVELALKGLQQPCMDSRVAKVSRDTVPLRPPEATRGARFLSGGTVPEYRPDWFADPNLKGVLNHDSRGHIPGDLGRYAFAACFGRAYGRSPTLKEFPRELLPNHENVGRAVERGIFNDRFRVQLANQPSTTITSHISKDGHYYIHPDPAQCRSLTVREAARLQTFPDNYHFEGPRTSQYVQVGNAVPPLLAVAIAGVVRDVLDAVV
jgi:DNA (cytosine-5)-methyltransferase 1